MKNKTNKLNVNGYIEGFYGQLLSWEDRKLIIKSLNKNKMNTYFYAPKEDVCHRICWRKKYDKKWRLSFQNFTQLNYENNFNYL